MSLWELLVIAVGLSMDAFAVSVCKGLSVQKVKTKHYLIVAAYFGGFQALMPLLGYLLGVRFEAMVANVDHWIAFVLLGLIGANMVRESRAGEEKLDDSFTVSTMLILDGRRYCVDPDGNQDPGTASAGAGVNRKTEKQKNTY